MLHEDLLEGFEKLRLTTMEEETAIDMYRSKATSENPDEDFYLVGKLLSSRFISGEVMRNHFKRIWKVERGLNVKKLG